MPEASYTHTLSRPSWPSALWHSLFGKVQSRTNMLCKILAGSRQPTEVSLGLRGNWTVTMHICLVFLHAAEGFITRPVWGTHTWNQPGFSSGPEPITAVWLHSSEKQPRDHIQLCTAAGVCNQVCCCNLIPCGINCRQEIQIAFPFV